MQRLLLLHRIYANWKFSSKLHLLRAWKLWECFLWQKSQQLLNHVSLRKVKEKGHIGGTEGEIPFWETESPRKLDCSAKIDLLACDAHLANTMYCWLCSFIPCVPGRKFGIVLAFSMIFKTSILPTLNCSTHCYHLIYHLEAPLYFDMFIFPPQRLS